MASRTVGPFDIPDPDDLREITRIANEAAEMTRAINQDQEIYKAIHQDREMYREIREAGELYRPILESAASQVRESVAAIPRIVAATKLDRNQQAMLRIAKQQLEAVSAAREHLDFLRSSGLF